MATKSTNIRQSNMEAMRVVSMLMVLMLHCTALANGMPSWADIESQPLDSLFFTEIEAITLVCVNCFVLISGYFGIRFSFKGLCKLLFIVYFYRLGILAGASALHGSMPSAGSVALCFNPFGGEWFVVAYIGLYFTSPILNLAADHSSQPMLRKALIAYLAMMLTVGWVLSPLPDKTLNFVEGYSTLSFIGIYLTGRYIGRFYHTSDIPRHKLVLVFLGAVTANALMYMALSGVMRSPGQTRALALWFMSYDSILTIAASVSILLLFTTLNFSSRLVNWLGASAFSVYLIHCNPLVLGTYLEFARDIYTNCWPWLWLPGVLAYILVIYLGCTLIDQVRIFCWSLILPIFNNPKQ